MSLNDRKPWRSPAGGHIASNRQKSTGGGRQQNGYHQEQVPQSPAHHPLPF
jgi:hypothetical protein